MVARPRADPSSHPERVEEERAALFDGLFHCVHDPCVVLDERAVIVDANPAALDFAGAEREDVVGRARVFDFVQAEDRASAEALFAATLGGARPTAVLRAMGREGAALVEFSARRVELPQGRRVVLVARDVTAREREAQRMRTILEAHRVVEHAPSPPDAARTMLDVFAETLPAHMAQILMLRPRTRLLEHAAATGLPPRVEEHVESRVADVDWDEALPARAFRDPEHAYADAVDATSLPADVRAALAASGCVSTVAYALKAQDGEPFGVLVAGVPHEVPTVADGTIADVGSLSWLRVAADEIGACLDRLSQKERVEYAWRRERRLNEELAAFAYRTSHDLSEPLRGIETLARLARQDLDAGAHDSVDDLLQRIILNADRLKRLIARVLDLSHAGRAEDDGAPWNLVEVARSVTDELTPILRRRNVSVLIETPMPVVRASRRRVHAILSNVVANAVRHNESPEPRAWIRAHLREDGFVEVSVSDNGAGIPREERERVFEMFRRGEGSASDDSGVGLTIARHVVALEGGDMWVQDAPEGGADFRFTLPAG